MPEAGSSLTLKILAALVLGFTLCPVIMLIIAAFNPAPYFTFPPEDFSFKWFQEFFNNREYQSALQVSVVVALSAVVVALITGIPAAFAVDRYDFPGKPFIHTLLLSSLLLPRVIWAVALLQYYALLRVLGSPLGLILAHSVLVLPYVVRMVLSSLAYVDRDVEKAAQSLGASPLRSFVEITLPLVLPGVIIGAVFGFVISFTDVVVATFISGVRFITLPVRIYVEQRGQEIAPTAIAASAVVILVIIVLEIVGEKFFKWSRFM